MNCAAHVMMDPVAEQHRSISEMHGDAHSNDVELPAARWHRHHVPDHRCAAVLYTPGGIVVPDIQQISNIPIYGYLAVEHWCPSSFSPAHIAVVSCCVDFWNCSRMPDHRCPPLSPAHAAFCCGGAFVSVPGYLVLSFFLWGILLHLSSFFGVSSSTFLFGCKESSVPGCPRGGWPLQLAHPCGVLLCGYFWISRGFDTFPIVSVV